MVGSFSQRYSDFLISNIENNLDYFNNYKTFFNDIPLSMDHENIKKIMSLIKNNGISFVSPTIFIYPYNEVLAVVNHMKSNGFDLSSKSFQTDFWKTYDEYAPYDTLLKDSYLSDEFMEQNGLIRIKDRRYSNTRLGVIIERNYNNPLPNLKR